MNNKLIATTLGLIGLTFAQVTVLPVEPTQAAQSFTCEGRMNNGWTYTANYLDGRFTQIRWKKSGQPPQTSNLTYKNENSQNQPIYQGSLFGAVGVTLVDLSGGNVTPGSSISVTVDEWGSSETTCGTGTSSAVQNFTCEGSMNNGWNYSAKYVDNRFTQIRWQRSGQPPQTSNLTSKKANTKGQPIYQGSLFAAVAVTLVDLSGGNVKPGSSISVTVEEWGTSETTCAPST